MWTAPLSGRLRTVTYGTSMSVTGAVHPDSTSSGLFHGAYAWHTGDFGGFDGQASSYSLRARVRSSCAYARDFEGGAKTCADARI